MSLTYHRLTKRKFYDVRNRFHRQVTVNPLTCEVYSLYALEQDCEDGYEKAVGSLHEYKKKETLNCLFDLEAIGKSRTRFGIREDTEAVIYISPVQLFKKFGFKKFPDTNTVIITYLGEEYVISFARYLEEMFGDCVAIQLQLKTSKRGGG